MLEMLNPGLEMGRIGVRFRVGWARIGSVRAVKERGVKDGSFQVSQVEPSAFERVLAWSPGGCLSPAKY